MTRLLIITSIFLVAGCGEISEDQQREQFRADLADEVKAGQKSFEQAGCEFRGGDWNLERYACDEWERP